MENELKGRHNKIKLSKFCMDAGFLSVVENGQYLMTKDTADLSQFHAVACRECTLPREEPASQPKGWIQGNTQIGPVEVATSCLHGVNMELRSEFGLRTETILTPGSEFLMDQISL